MSANKKLLVLPGDGIGPEVMGELMRVIEWFDSKGALKFDVDTALVGGAAYDAEGAPISDATMAKALKADAVLFGAVGGPKWEPLPFAVRPERGLLRLRKELELFANLRPAKVFSALADASALKPELVDGLDIMIVRELTGGVYFGTPRGIETLPDGQKRGFNTQSYTTSEIDRVARVAFDLARKRGNKLCSVEKANVMESGELWREVVQEIHDQDYPDVNLSHMYADNCAMQLVRYPKQFDVIVTDNLFGAPDAGGNRKAMYEPIHGSAPDIAGKGLANPLANFLSFAMMLRYSFDLPAEAAALEAAIETVLGQGIRTADIRLPDVPPVSTAEMGKAVLGELQKLIG